MPPLTPRRKAKAPPRATTTQRGYGSRHQKIRAAFLRTFPICRCGAWAKEMHHKDRNTSNTAASNLEALCTACHQREHGKGASE